MLFASKFFGVREFFGGILFMMDVWYYSKEGTKDMW